MKRITLAIVALALAFPALQAQQKDGNETNREPKTYRQHQGKQGMHHDRFKDLNLTKEQQDQLAKINNDFRTAVTDLKKKESSITMKDYKTQMETLRTKRKSETDNVLTAEQKSQLQKMRQDKGGRPGMKGKGMRGGMNADLGLSKEQSAQVEALRASSQKKIKDIRESQNLSESQKKEQIMTVWKQQHENMKSILTAEQMKKMEGFRQGGRSRQISR